MPTTSATPASSTIHSHSNSPQSRPPTKHPTTRRRRSLLYLLYAPLPLFAALVWFATVLALLLTWLTSGRPHYVSMSPGQRIAYISDVGADRLKPLFVVGCVITGSGFFLTLAAERWLRHEGRLLPNTSRREKVFSSLAILGAFIGGGALILLSAFDTKRHMVAHRIFLLIFVLGVALSAIFTVIEYRLLTRTHAPSSSSPYPLRTLRALHHSYILKATLTILLILLAIAFGALLGSGRRRPRRQDGAAVLEWSIAFGFTVYLGSFAWDLGMIRGVGRGEMKRAGENGENGVGGEYAMGNVNARDGHVLGNETANGDVVPRMTEVGETDGRV